MRLTERDIDGLACKSGQKDKLFFDDMQRGLAVRVTAAGSKTYLCQYTIGGSKKRVPLGSVDALSLAKAREAVAAIMGDLAKGHDPAAQRKAEAAERKAKDARDGFTLSVLISDWERLHLSTKRGSYAVEAVRALKNGFVKYLDLPAADLDRKAVVKVADGIAASGSATMAGRLVAYGSAAYGWALKRGSLSVNPFLTVPVAATPKRERVLSDEELAEVWRASDPCCAAQPPSLSSCSGVKSCGAESIIWPRPPDCRYVGSDR